MKRFNLKIDGIRLQSQNARRETMRPDEYAKAFEFAIWAHRSAAFWLGDMLASGLDLFGDDIWQHLEYDMSLYDHLERCRGISAKVPPENRNENLSWTHHAFVASVPVKYQKAALEHAAEEGLNSDEFQKWIASQRKVGAFKE